jgi:hypothetical protein
MKSAPVLEETSARTNTWKTMKRREKWIFVAKLGVMLASFGWIYGNALAPDEERPPTSP